MGRDAILMEPTKDWKGLVVTIKADLEARGQTWKTNCDAFQITGRVAWALRNHGALLIKKHQPQNGCYAVNNAPGVSHDAIAFPDGWVDCLVDAGPPENRNVPAWGWHPSAAPPPPTSVVAPWDLDAGVVIPPPLEPPPPPPPETTSAPLPDLSKLPATWSPSNYPLRSLGFYTEAAIALEQIYRVVFGRAADWGGAGNWMYHIIEQTGISTPAWVAEQFMQSPEFYQLHPELKR